MEREVEYSTGQEKGDFYYLDRHLIICLIISSFSSFLDPLLRGGGCVSCFHSIWQHAWNQKAISSGQRRRNLIPRPHRAQSNCELDGERE
jgi:hypothetical protein